MIRLATTATMSDHASALASALGLSPTCSGSTHTRCGSPAPSVTRASGGGKTESTGRERQARTDGLQPSLFAGPSLQETARLTTPRQGTPRGLLCRSEDGQTTSTFAAVAGAVGVAEGVRAQAEGTTLKVR